MTSQAWPVTSGGYEDCEVIAVASSREQAEAIAASYGGYVHEPVDLWHDGEAVPEPRHTYSCAVGDIDRWGRVSPFVRADDGLFVGRWTHVLPPGMAHAAQVRPWSDEGGNAASADGCATAEEAERAARSEYEAAFRGVRS